ncbi:SDR family oxidoreductase [Bordetella bronchiseptica]|uniref:SDR family oxidoreductase n=1 Tax=Bordetella bronchiseptica TaxID=518 RepID=UPI00046173E2|nr:SDR family NAD(P)-dependent oxidoreductase [Bordetella bronchiseptica]AWQ06428.1 3-oxoacyl-ACP reductase [Bordetella bronchiseptica]KDC18980.1 KR domain protein [Bordetella bronchiseptica F-1]KDC31189.1 KR domain protein [Bordetella bronchiseptica F2]KDD64578.1 KR domain protein [Bordetella bronchiseptica OSU553]
MTAANRTALVTGAARGIGLAIATRLALDGHPVIMLDASPDVEASARALAGRGLRAHGMRLDISDEQAVRDLPRQCGQWWENLAIVVNNAGISPKHEGRKRKVAEMPLDEWRRVLEVNLTGTFLVTQTCLPALIAAGWGRIIMITSQAARTRTPVPGAHYSATKSGMTGLARVLAGEVAEHGITVNCVAPGRIQSAMTAEVGGAVNASHSATVPLGRLGLPEEVAATVAFLASDGAGYTTGATIDVNGGSFML